MNHIVLMSALAGLGTPAGALIALVSGRPSERYIAFAYGLAASVMTLVTTGDLWPAALQHLRVPAAACCAALGGALLYLLQSLAHARSSRGSWLAAGMVIASGISLHNFPEGLAIGAGYHSSAATGELVTAALAIHNAPEGLGLAAPFRMHGWPSWQILAVATAAGLVTPAGTWFSLQWLAWSRLWLGPFLALAAGAMLYLSFLELWPSAWRADRWMTAAGSSAGLLLAWLLL